MPADKDGVIAALDSKHQASYPGVTDYKGSLTEIVKSPWSNWKPKHGPPYKVAVSWSGLFNDYQVQIWDTLKKEFAKAGYKTDFKTTGNVLNVPDQLQQFDQLITGKPDLIVLQAATPGAFRDEVKRAAKAGIPVITANSSINGPDPINVDANYNQNAGNLTSELTRALGGKGNVVLVHGIAGSGNDSQAGPAWKDVFATCPGIKVAGEVYGGYDNSIAKSEMLKYLGTHPQKVDGVIETGAMGAGILQAFQQSGRPIPIIAEGGPSKQVVGYWNKHKDRPYLSGGVGPGPVAGSVVAATKLMLETGRPKLNLLLAVAPTVDNSNIKEWADPSWDDRTQGLATGPSDWFLSEDYLKGFFGN
jgi:ribose transport system substrate-binding protein